ncbi:MAG: DsbA family protein [Candidatus Dojkabacteria bacterium]|jgi:protein-disulfide isomerase
MEKERKEVTINLDTLGVPIAIIIAALIIAGVVWMTNSKRNTTSLGNESKSGTVTQDSGSKETENSETNTNSDSSSSKGVSARVDNDPFLGDRSKAKVAVVEFSDATCSYCQRHEDQTLPEIKKNYVDTGKVIYVFKEWPRGDNGSLTYEIAEGGMCVYDQKGSEVFAEYHKEAFNITNIAGIKTLATKLGVDVKAFEKCMEDGKFVDDLDSDRTEGKKVGVSGTPGFVVGKLDAEGNVTGELIPGAYPYSTFQSAIDKYLE